jgi:hypothetical protein
MPQPIRCWMALPSLNSATASFALPNFKRNTFRMMIMVNSLSPMRCGQIPVHVACLIEIAGLGVVPGWALFAMLRRAAPLERAWSARRSRGTLGQRGGDSFVCPIDDPAHQLVGHVLPVVVLSTLGAIAGRRYLNWMSRDGWT